MTSNKKLTTKMDKTIKKIGLLQYSYDGRRTYCRRIEDYRTTKRIDVDAVVDDLKTN
jgi:hypothetical protein